MINKGIMKLLLERTGVSKQRIYQMINEKKKEYNYAISKEIAAYLLAAEYDIDISKILSNEELAKVLETRKHIIITKDKTTTKAVLQPQILEMGKELSLVDPYLQRKIIKDAIEMSKVYPVLYLFENSIRNIILLMMGSKYGSDWWETRTSREIKEKVEKRIIAENRNRWHSKRGAHKIFYTDIDDLGSIIMTNWQDFKDIFPDLTWVKSRIDAIELSRNIVAHNNPLPKKEIQRLRIYFDDWIKQTSKKIPLRKYEATA